MSSLNRLLLFVVSLILFNAYEMRSCTLVDVMPVNATESTFDENGLTRTIQTIWIKTDFPMTFEENEGTIWLKPAHPMTFEEEILKLQALYEEQKEEEKESEITGVNFYCKSIMQETNRVFEEEIPKLFTWFKEQKLLAQTRVDDERNHLLDSFQRRIIQPLLFQTKTVHLSKKELLCNIGAEVEYGDIFLENTVSEKKIIEVFGAFDFTERALNQSKYTIDQIRNAMSDKKISLLNFPSYIRILPAKNCPHPLKKSRFNIIVVVYFITLPGLTRGNPDEVEKEIYLTIEELIEYRKSFFEFPLYESWYGETINKLVTAYKSVYKGCFQIPENWSLND